MSLHEPATGARNRRPHAQKNTVPAVDASPRTPSGLEALTGRDDDGAMASHFSDQQALTAVRSHHADMLDRASALSQALTAAVEAGDNGAVYDEKGNLIEWCTDDLVPHCVAEEERIYPAAEGVAEAQLLVEGLRHDHEAIAALLEELRISDGVRAAAVGQAIVRAFSLHADKEDALLFPALASAPGSAFAEAVEGLEEVVGAA